jgi:hypothetical protein
MSELSARHGRGARGRTTSDATHGSGR